MTSLAGGDPPADPGAGSMPVPAPAAAALTSMPPDAWAWLLVHVRAALHGLDATERTAVVDRLRAAPTSRLAGGRTRRELADLLARGGPLWRDVVRRVGDASDAPEAVRTLLLAGSPPATAPRDDRPAPAPAAADERTEARLRVRLRELRTDRDDLRRQLAGASARAAAADLERAGLEEELTALREEVARLRADLERSADDRDRAVERERRRRDAEVRQLTETVTDLRRSEAERHAEHRRRRQAEADATARAQRSATKEIADHRVDGPGRLVPGRPSRLPAGVAPGTTDAADLLLHPGRSVLVDGYNVTKQHQPTLDLEGQRAWLVRTLAALAARRRVRPQVVFDGQAPGSSRAPTGAREVTVTFTPAGVTADDELVLIVEATDGPVTVVTDDRELTERLRASGADVIGTRPFLGVTRRT